MNNTTEITEEEMLRVPVLTLRLGTLAVVVALLTIHVRSMRIFRWEQSVSGGILVTYSIATLGLALCAGSGQGVCGGEGFQAYLCATGAALFVLNAGYMWHHWRHSSELTRVVAELLEPLGVKLKRQMIIKVSLSAIVAAALLIDLGLMAIVIPKDKRTITVSLLR